jgi:adenylate cyclase
MGQDTTVARAIQGRRNEEMVLAESALRAERVVALVRPVLFLMFGLTQGVLRRLAGDDIPMDAGRGVAIALYAVFCAGTIWGTYKSAPDPVAAERWPLLLATVDYAFNFYMGYRTNVVQGFLRPDMTAAACAAILAFSAGRKGVHHVAYSTLLACLSYGAVTASAGMFQLGFASHVFGSYLGLGLILGWFNHNRAAMFLDLRRRDTLSRLLPSAVAERLMRMDGALKPAQREVTVLFSDVRDFTTLSENRPPEEILAMLDEYFGHMSQIVKGHDGMVNKYLGDGMLAVWNAPDTVPDHAERALKAARDMVRKLEELNEHWARAGHPTIRIGIGIHSGTVAAGMLGGDGQQEYTVIGDAVNLASRVEGLTKGSGTPILVTQETFKQLKHPERCRKMGEHPVKGRAAPVVVYTPEELAPPEGQVHG